MTEQEAGPRDLTAREPTARSAPLGALRGARALLGMDAELFEAMPDAVVVVDGKGRIVVANSAAEALTGYERDELGGKQVDELVPHAKRAVHRRHRGVYGRAPQRRPMGSSLALALTNKTGTDVAVDISLSPLEVDGARYVVCAIRDATERRHLQASLEQSERRYRDLFENASDMILTFDLELNVTSANKSCAAALGYSLDELLGMNVRQLLAPEVLELSFQQLERKLTGGESQTIYESKLLTKDSHHVTIEVSSRLVRDDDGEPVGVQAICRDVTVRRALEAHAAEMQRLEALGRLAGGVAHDFNNILLVVRGYADVLKPYLRGTPAARDLEEILAAANRGASLVNQLLTFGRAQPVTPAVLDLAALVQGLEGLLQQLLTEDITVELALEQGLGRVRADPTQLEQMIINLATNARDAMPHGGRITITGENTAIARKAPTQTPGLTAGRYVKLTIADTGGGIPSDVLPHIFDPFFTTKEAGRGSGLGLATVHAVVAGSGGAITVESEPDAGARFTIYLPRVVARTTRTAARRRTHSPLGGTETILVVEDERAARALVRRVLAERGYKVLEAAAPSEALAVAANHAGPIDLLVSDVVMPEFSGPELARALLSERPELRVLLISGYSNSDALHGASLAQTWPVLRKPFSADELLDRVQQTLAPPR